MRWGLKMQRMHGCMSFPWMKLSNLPMLVVYQVKPGINTSHIEYNCTKKSRSTALLRIHFGRKWKRNESGLSCCFVFEY